MGMLREKRERQVACSDACKLVVSMNSVKISMGVLRLYNARLNSPSK